MLWAIVETIQIRQGDASLPRLLAAVTGHILLPVIEIVLILGVLGFLWDRPRIGGTIKRVIQDHGAAWQSTFMGLLITSAAIFEAMIRLNNFSNSVTVRALGIALLVPVLSAIFIATTTAAMTIATSLGARFPGRGRPWTIVGINAVALTLWAIYLKIRGDEVFQAMETQWLLGLFLIATCGLLSMAFLAKTPTARRWMLLPLIPMIGLSGLHLATTPGSAVKQTLAQSHGHLVSTVYQKLNPKKRKQVAKPATLEAPRCRPGDPPIDLNNVGVVDDDAPDIIFITIDAWRWDKTQLSGRSRRTTPLLKVSAKSAAVFTNAYSPSGSTRQSMGAMFTGLFPSQIPFKKEGPRWGLRLPEGQPTLAGVLRTGGYKTIAIISDKNAFPSKHGALQGFDVIDKRPYRFFKKHKYSASIQVNKVMSYLAELPEPGAPRFVWTHIREAHHPYRSGPMKRRFGKGTKNKYDSSLYYVDYELNRIVEFARSAERKRNTIVVVSSDHGEGFEEHDWKYHGSKMYEEFIHVPMLFWGPKIKARRHHTPTSVIDVSKTIVSLATLNPPKAWCGRDLRRYLERGIPIPDRPVFVEVLPDKTKDYFLLALRVKDTKLIWDPDLKKAEVYDLATDRKEKNDLADEDPKRTARLINKLIVFLRTRGLDPAAYNLSAKSLDNQEDQYDQDDQEDQEDQDDQEGPEE